MPGVIATRKRSPLGSNRLLLGAMLLSSWGSSLSLHGQEPQKTTGITSSQSLGYKPLAFKPYGTVHVLPIGISQYRGSLFGPLALAEADAKAVASVFRERFGYNVHPPLLGSQATKAAIEAAIEQYKTVLGPDDVLIVFFAGHGASVGAENERRGFLVPYGFDPANTSNVVPWQGQAIDMQKLGVGLVALNTRHVLLLLDACYSGFLGTRSGGSAGRVDLDLLLTQPSRLALTAGTEKQEALEGGTLNGKPLVNSIFTTALLQALNTNEAFSIRELALSVRKNVVTWSQSRMQPLLRDLAPKLYGEFVFIPTASKTASNGSLLDSVLGFLRARGLAGTTLNDFYKALAAPIIGMDLRQKTPIVRGMSTSSASKIMRRSVILSRWQPSPYVSPKASALTKI